MDAVAKKHKVSIANVACRYILDQPAVAGIIVGAHVGKSCHIEDNRKILGLRLDREDIDRLEASASALKRIPGDCGDEYRRPPYLTGT